MVKPVYVIAKMVNLTDEIREKYNIIEYASPVAIDGKDYLTSEVPFSKEEFSRMLVSGKHTFESAVSPPEVYKKIYESIPDETPIYVICFSSKLSAFVKSARTAADEFPDKDITVLETPYCPPAMSFYPMVAAGMAEKAQTNEELKPQITAIYERMRIYHALFSLTYLHQAGRISAAKAFLGKMMKIVPLITTNDEGMIVPAGKARRIEKSLDRICDFIETDINQKKGSSIDMLVTYTGSRGNAEMLREKLESRFDVNQNFMLEGGYLILRYLGPDAAGLVYYVNP